MTDLVLSPCRGPDECRGLAGAAPRLSGVRTSGTGTRSASEFEEGPGFPGVLRAAGGMGGPFEAPHMK
jgi:hypothetical protein